MSAVRGSAFCRDIISAVMGICPGASDYWLPWPSTGGWGMSLINILISQNKLYMYKKGTSHKYPIPIFAILDWNYCNFCAFTKD